MQQTGEKKNLRVEFDDLWLERLDIREGVKLRVVLETGPPWRPAMLASADPDARILVVEATDADGQSSQALLLRVLPARGGEPHREFRDLVRIGPRPAGVPRQAVGTQTPAFGSPLPAMLFCPEKSVWIGVPDAGGDGGESGKEPLETLWRTVVDGGTGVSDPPACVTCDRKERCYPTPEPSEGPETSGSVLLTVAPWPWHGVLLEPVHLPLTAWLRLLSGVPSDRGGTMLSAVPETLRDELPGLGDEGAVPVPGNPMLVRLGALRQLLRALEHVSVDLDHPHLGLNESSVWVRVDPAERLPVALAAAQPVLLDLAPGWGRGANGAETYAHPDWQDPTWVPASGSGAGEWHEGLCITCHTTSEGATHEILEVSFLPTQKLESAPSAGDPIELRIRGEAAGGEDILLPGTVKVGFREVCRILVDPGTHEADEVRGMLAGEHGGSTVDVRPAASNPLADDLYALGTLWIAALTNEPDNPQAAAQLRDALGRALGELPPDADEAQRAETAHRLARSSDLFTPPQGAGAVQDAHAGTEAIGRCLLLGMRFCGALPDSYPHNDAAEVGRDERREAFVALRTAIDNVHDDLVAAHSEQGASARTEVKRLETELGKLRVERDGLRREFDKREQELLADDGRLREEIERLREQNAALQQSGGTLAKGAAAVQGSDLARIRELLMLPSTKKVDVVAEGLPATEQRFFDLNRLLSQFARDYELAVIFVLASLAGQDMGTRWFTEKKQEVHTRYRDCLQNKAGSLEALRESLKVNHKFFVDLNQAYLDSLPRALAGALEKIDPQAALESHKQMFGFDYKATWQEIGRLHNDLGNMSRDELWELYLQPPMRKQMAAYLPKG